MKLFFIPFKCIITRINLSEHLIENSIILITRMGISQNKTYTFDNNLSKISITCQNNNIFIKNHPLLGSNNLVNVIIVLNNIII